MKISFRSPVVALALMLPWAVPTAWGAELWVDNCGGNDANAGSRAAPFQSVARAVRELKPGTILHLQPTAEPYAAGIRIEVSGTPEAPIVIDGHGSRVSGLRRLPGSQWKAEGGDVFSRPLPNNAWGMEHCWEGGFELVRFAGQPGRNVTAREKLEPLAYFLHKNRQAQKTDPLHNTLFIRLPAGQTPDDLAVESIAAGGGIYVGGSHVTVRNLICEYVGDDGFATHRNKGVVFENVEARHNMDQGMSHHGAEVVVRNGYFHHNAGCGIVDVYPEAKVRYEHCLIEADTWRGGVELHSGIFAMTDCLIRANPKIALTVTRGARVKLRNCLFIAPAPGTTTGLNFDGSGAELELENCTFYGFAVGVNARFAATGAMRTTRCAWLRCAMNSRITAAQAAGADAVEPKACLHFAGNVYEPAPWEVLFQQQADQGGWKNDRRSFAAIEHARFAELIGGDAEAVIASVEGADDPLALPPLRTAAGEPAGARLPQPFAAGVLPSAGLNQP